MEERGRVYGGMCRQEIFLDKGSFFSGSRVTFQIEIEIDTTHVKKL